MPPVSNFVFMKVPANIDSSDAQGVVATQKGNKGKAVAQPHTSPSEEASLSPAKDADMMVIDEEPGIGRVSQHVMYQKFFQLSSLSIAVIR